MTSNILLVVDDDKICRMLPGFLLRPFGITVLECDSSHEALRLMGTHKVHSILIDVSMPKSDGIDFVSSVLKFPQYSAINLIAYTADDRLKDNDDYKKNGFHQLIVKPVGLHDLLGIFNIN